MAVRALVSVGLRPGHVSVMRAMASTASRSLSVTAGRAPLALFSPSVFSSRDARQQHKHATFLAPTREKGTAAYQKMYNASIKNPEKFWAKEGRQRLLWRRDFDQAKRVNMTKGSIQWFAGGQLNASENCIDRHLVDRANDVALIYEADNKADSYNVTYQELHDEVCRLANVLKTHGVKKGDSVCIYMPMTPYVVYSMLACARIGAVHSVVFAGFSAEALHSRIVAAQSKVVITADEAMRGGKTIPLKETVDAAVSDADCVTTVLVQKRTGAHIPMGHRDVRIEEAMDKERPVCPVQVMDSEDPLFILYTSGSTGMPKGLVHTTGGYCTYASMTHEHIFDYKRGDVYGCMADAGWITGHTYVTYGPLLNGGSTILFESIPTYPDAGRYWEMVQRLKINQFYTAPTAIRMLIKSGPEFVKKYDRSSLRILGSVGEPINPEAWKWYNDVVGDGNCKIVDTWWQTETGGICMTPLPEDDDMKPGAAMRPFYGVEPVLVDNNGVVLEGNDVSGNLCLKQIPPGMSRTVHGDHDRFQKVYYNDFPGLYFTGDGARRDADGDYWITGRVDDVINVSGHRMGTAEVESALVEHSSVAEAAVVGFPHEIKGQGIYAYVTLKNGQHESPKLLEDLGKLVRKMVGPFAKPDVIQIAPGLPKTRSGKIMRRVLRKVAANEISELGDTSTLADPSVVSELISKAAALRGE